MGLSYIFGHSNSSCTAFPEYVRILIYYISYRWFIVRVAPEEAGKWFISGLRFGTHLPGGYVCAYFYHWSLPKDLWIMSGDKSRVVCLEFKEGSEFGRIYVEIPTDQDLEAIVSRLRRHLSTEH